MKKRRLFLILALGMGLTSALLWILGYQSPSAVAAPSAGPVKVPSVPATELHVCPSGCTYSSVQAAVDAASDGAVIKVAAGTYTDTVTHTPPSGYVNPPASGVITQVVHISKTLTIRGGYTTTNWTTSDPVANPTTLDAESSKRAIFVGGGITVTLENLHITGGDAAGLGGDVWGDAGGGVYVTNAAAALSGNDIYSNTAGSGGGGVFLGKASHDTTLSGNNIYNNTANWSGGVCVWDSDDAVLSGNHIHNNATNYDGGGVFLGGYSDNITLSGNDIHDNVAGIDGGGVLLRADDATLSGNYIYSNTADYDGGGIQVYLSDNATLDNNVIVDNQANGDGSGVYVRISTVDLRHNTIARNTGGDGSGVHVVGTGNSNVTLTNTILVSQTVGITVTAGNTATLEGTLWGNGIDWGGDGAIFTGTVNIWGDPAFVDPDGGDYHIGPASAARNAGVNAGVTTDIDGETRPKESGYDIGADEFGQQWDIYLPLVLKNFFISPYEPNNNATQAYGPLQRGVAYRAYPDDTEDWYYFILSTTSSITVRVENFSANGDLLIYKDPNISEPVDQWGQGGSTMTVGPLSLDAGKYYIRVYAASGYNTTTLYTLKMTY